MNLSFPMPFHFLVNMWVMMESISLRMVKKLWYMLGAQLIQISCNNCSAVHLLMKSQLRWFNFILSEPHTWVIGCPTLIYGFGFIMCCKMDVGMWCCQPYLHLHLFLYNLLFYSALIAVLFKRISTQKSFLPSICN